MGLFDFLKKNTTTRRQAIFDVNDKDFKQLVLQRSYKTTVVVDFWAAWCGPCRVLGPTLERIAEEPDGQFVLAKLNTEFTSGRRPSIKSKVFQPLKHSEMVRLSMNSQAPIPKHWLSASSRR